LELSIRVNNNNIINTNFTLYMTPPRLFYFDVLCPGLQYSPLTK